MIELVALSYSPWSEKARWALDHHAVDYREVAYKPMLGERALGRRLRKLDGKRAKVTVPALVADDVALRDSFEIARFAERIGHGAALFPAGREAEIEHWNQRSEEALAGGRALATARVGRDPEAQREALAGIVPAPLRGVLRPLAWAGTSFLRRKYRFGSDADLYREHVRLALVDLRAGLGGGRYLLGSLSYADVVMAVGLTFVRPPGASYLRLGPATLRAFTDEPLATEFADLLAWRDRLYADHRGRS